ncbi:MAG: hypothetical protein Q7U91_13180 [Sideroxyarcus sp.]|nr:hypothetical protein [Sideroxyarcus sp.]
MNSRRNVLKWIALGAIFTTVIAATSSGEDGTPKAARASVELQGGAVSPLRAEARLPAQAHVELERLARPQAEPAVVVANVFGSTSWYVPPPPPPPAPPPPPPVPTAPPMPFSYLGRYEDAPTRLAILTRGERMYTVAEGDVIDNTYRIERVTSTMVEMTYMPLNIRQTLGTGEAL